MEWDAAMLLETLIDLAPDAIFIADLNGYFTEVNRFACQLLGYRREELLGKTIADLIGPEDLPRLAAARELMLQGNVQVEYWTHLHKDGSRIPTEVSAKILPDGRWVAFVRDIRQRQQAELALREKEQQWQQLSDSIPQFVWIRDAMGNLNYVNQQWCEYSGLTPEQSQDVTQRVQCYHPDDRDLALEQWALALATKQQFEFEARVKRAIDGAYRWFLIRGVPVLDEQGEVQRWYGISTDIHDRKITELNERFLRNLELRLRQLSDPDQMLWEAVSRIGEYLNVERCVWHEVNLQEDVSIVKQDWRRQPDISSVVGLYPLSRSILPELIAQYHAGQPAVVPDVATHPYTAPFAQNFAQRDIRSFVGVPCIYEGRWVAVLAINARTVQQWRSDQVALLEETVARLWSIIEQTRAMQALQERTNHIQLLYETTRDLLSANQPLTLVETLFAKIKTLMGLDVYFNYVLDEERQQLHLEFYGGISEDTARQIEWLELGCAVCGTVAQQRCQMLQFDVPNSTDPKTQLVRSLGITAYSCQPLIAQGKLFGTLSFGSRTRMTFSPTETQLFQALCDQIAIALERSQLLSSLQEQTEELKQNNRLKDEFFSALSHELRTPLNPILGWTKLLQSQRLTCDQVTQALETIERNVQQQIRLVDDLLDVSRVIQGKMRLETHPVDLALTLKSAVETVAFAAQAKAITLEMNLTEPIYTLGDGDRLQQVFWNLLSNAIKFTPNGGQVDIELSVSQGHEGESVQIRVFDAGIGISADFLPHIFEYFRQAEGGWARRYSGLGLGLAIVHHLVELHGGTITAESPGLGKGATFTVKLPLLGSSPQKQRNLSDPTLDSIDKNHSDAFNLSFSPESSSPTAALKPPVRVERSYY
ncbi:PAS domain S-box protein [Aerosakkonemataceae cyanobacterium BLCC-F50]|uniref:histidine kinase n=1 Tax=Floridaenema flaviceps BLCC-F50 TaxID=3153642 RepID=A0ABV4XJP7_9CYAN